MVEEVGADLPSELCRGKRQAVLFATTMGFVAAEACIIVIDTPELGIASRDHWSMLSRYVALAGDNQVIVATGSDAIAQSGRKSLVADLEGQGVGRYMGT